MIRAIIELYIILIIIDTILHYIPQYRSKRWALYIRKYAGYSLRPVRRFMPKEIPFDLSPLVVIIGLKMLKAIW